MKNLLKIILLLCLIIGYVPIAQAKMAKFKSYSMAVTAKHPTNDHINKSDFGHHYYVKLS
jgi:hypothetical protein